MAKRGHGLTFIDLFAGCGGLTRGFIDAGLRLEAGYELDTAAAATFASNFGAERTHCADVKTLTNIPFADVVLGGPPCQGFSNLGKRDPHDIRNKLWRAFTDVVVESRADVFVFENVDPFARSTEFNLLLNETGKGRRLAGWRLKSFTLNAADFGVAQRRIRSIVIGTRVGDPEPPRHTHSKDGVDGLPRWRTLRDAIGMMDSYNLAPHLPDHTVEFSDWIVPGPFKLSEIHVERSYWDISLDRYKLIAPGRNRFDLPKHLQMECWKRHKSGSGDVLGRLEWDKPCVTIRTEFFKPEKGRYLHPEWRRNGRQVNRAISHAEAARIQDFDQRHVWCGSKLEIARQIGNAVPPGLATAVAYEVCRILQ